MGKIYGKNNQGTMLLFPNLATMPAMGKSQTCLYCYKNVTGCEADEIRYPALKLSMPPNVVDYKYNYTCYERTEGNIDRKIFGPGWCSRTIQENETEIGILVNHNLTRADMWWLCGDLKIRRNLQGVWKGQCTPINMVMPFKIIKGVAGDIKEELKRVKQLSRIKRAVTSPGGSFDNRVWIDSIGQGSATLGPYPRSSDPTRPDPSGTVKFRDRTRPEITPPPMNNKKKKGKRLHFTITCKEPD